MAITYEGFGVRPIEWVLEIQETHGQLFLEDPGSNNHIPVKLVRLGNAIRLEVITDTCSFLETNKETDFIEFAEVPDPYSDNSRFELSSSSAIAYLSL